MTVVSPSLTSTCVIARCVSIGGMPLTDAAEVGRRVLDRDLHDHGVRRGDLRRHLQRQRGVLERDGDGVVRHRLNRNLHALRDLGLDVVLRRRRAASTGCGPCPVVSSADSATSRLNAPLTEPEREPDGARRAGDAQVDRGRRVVGRRLAGPCVPPVRPVTLPWFGNASGVVLPSAGVDAAVEAPLHAERAREVAVRLDDARFDLDLRLRPVERVDQVAAVCEPVRQVGDDERVGARVDLDACRACDSTRASSAAASGPRPSRSSAAASARCSSPASACSSASLRRCVLFVGQHRRAARCGRSCRRRRSRACWRAG